MSKIVIDAETRAKLNGLRDRVELYDESGNLVGVCLPAEEYRQMAGGPGGFFTDEEIAEAMRQPLEGRPLADILRDLRAS